MKKFQNPAQQMENPLVDKPRGKKKKGGGTPWLKVRKRMRTTMFKQMR